jgi:hypothetical protein
MKAMNTTSVRLGIAFVTDPARLVREVLAEASIPTGLPESSGPSQYAPLSAHRGPRVRALTLALATRGAGELAAGGIIHGPRGWWLVIVAA